MESRQFSALRVIIVVTVLVASLAVLAAAPVAAGGPQQAAGPADGAQGAIDGQQQTDGDSSDTYRHVDEDDDPRTNETLGYVDGTAYDADLPVDDREDAVVEADELDAVVRRSMARVELVRERPFEESVAVDVRSREAFQAAEDPFVGNASAEARQFHNASFEALFMVDGETDAAAAFEALYGESVVGYYDPATDEIVVVSEETDSTTVNESILGHELVHALQDQHFDLSRLGTDTTDASAATDGLVEGDAVRVEAAYVDRCETEWDCLEPDEEADPAGESVNGGLQLTAFHPYSDGPDYVDHLHETGGWAAVDDAYENPPNSTAEVIRPGSVRDPVDVGLLDRSNDDWRPLEPTDQAATDTLGEAALASMFAYQADRYGADVRSGDTTAGDSATDGFDYDHAATDGWAGDEFRAYAAADTDLDAAATAYVWQTEWTDADEAAAFVEAYRAVLDAHDATAVADRDGVYELDGPFDAAFSIHHEGTRVAIVNAPTVADLDRVAEGSGNGTALETDDGAGGGVVLDAIPGFTPSAALLALLAVATVAALARRTRRR